MENKSQLRVLTREECKQVAGGGAVGVVNIGGIDYVVDISVSLKPLPAGSLLRPVTWEETHAKNKNPNSIF